MHFDIVTLFPDFFRGPLDYGVLHRALRTEKLSVARHDLRAFTTDRHRTVDDRPFGGGEGMVLKPEPLFDCVQAIGVAEKATRDCTRESVVLLSAAGKRFDQGTARRFASLSRIVLLCGRYEGVDERVAELLADQEISVGDFVLSGGELPAALILDAVARLLPGVLGHSDSSHYESFGEDEPTETNLTRLTHDTPQATHASGGLLDYPHYTRPAVFRGSAIPEALASGDHAAVRAWRRRAALLRTLRLRPDLLERAALSESDQAILRSAEFPSEQKSGEDSKI